MTQLSNIAPFAATASRVSPWIQAAADYQRLYSRETLANVTEDPQLTARVLGELRSADGISVQIPDLRSAGMTFKRVQRLSLHQQPIVQMVYLPERGDPVAVCVTRDSGADEAPRSRQIGEMSAAAWRRGGLGYVLLGKGPPQTLLDLAQRIASGEGGSLYSPDA